MPSVYLSCDKPGCMAVFDRRKKPSTANDGTYWFIGGGADIRRDATAAGWTCSDKDDKDYCPNHKPTD